MTFDEKAQAMYDLYIDNVVAYLNKTKVARLYQDEDGEQVEYEDPNETFMRGLEEDIDISEVHADDFRRSVLIKWATQIRKEICHRPNWKNDFAMKDAINIRLRLIEGISTITTITPGQVRSQEEMFKVHGHREDKSRQHQHLGKPQFDDGQLVRFNTTCDLAHWTDREEEERSKTVKEGMKGRIICAIPRSTCWYYAVELPANSFGEYYAVEAPFSILQDKSWYDEEARRLNETDTYMDSEAASIAAGGDNYLRFNELKPNSGMGYEEVQLNYPSDDANHLQQTANGPLAGSHQECICSIDTLMSSGCKCGHLEKK